MPYCRPTEIAIENASITPASVEPCLPSLRNTSPSTTLAGLRRTALHRLMEQYQQSDPFKFLIYAELAGAEIGPAE